MRSLETLEPGPYQPAHAPFPNNVFRWAQRAISASLDTFVAWPRCSDCGAVMEFQTKTTTTLEDGVAATGREWACTQCSEWGPAQSLEENEPWA